MRVRKELSRGVKIVLLFLLILLISDILIIYTVSEKDVLPLKEKRVEITDPNLTLSSYMNTQLTTDGRYICVNSCELLSNGTTTGFYYLYSVSGSERPYWAIEVDRLRRGRKSFYYGDFLTKDTFVYILTDSPINASNAKTAEVWYVNHTDGLGGRIFNWSATPPGEGYDSVVNLIAGYDPGRFWFIAVYERWNESQERTTSKVFEICELKIDGGMVKKYRLEFKGKLAEASFMDIDRDGKRGLLLTDSEIYAVNLTSGRVKSLHRMDKYVNTIVNGLYYLSYAYGSFGPDDKTILLGVEREHIEIGGSSFYFYILDEGGSIYPVYLDKEEGGHYNSAFISEDGKSVILLRDNEIIRIDLNRDKAEDYVSFISTLELVIYSVVVLFLIFLFLQFGGVEVCQGDKRTYCSLMILFLAVIVILIITNYVFGGMSRLGGVLFVSVLYVWTYLKSEHKSGKITSILFLLLLLWQAYVLLYVRASYIGCIAGV